MNWISDSVSIDYREVIKKSQAFRVNPITEW